MVLWSVMIMIMVMLMVRVGLDVQPINETLLFVVCGLKILEGTRYWVPSKNKI